MTVAVEQLLPGRGKLASGPIFSEWRWDTAAIGLHGSNVKSKGPFREYEYLPDGQPEILIAFDFDVRYRPR